MFPIVPAHIGTVGLEPNNEHICEGAQNLTRIFKLLKVALLEIKTMIFMLAIVFDVKNEELNEIESSVISEWKEVYAMNSTVPQEYIPLHKWNNTPLYDFITK